MDQARLRLNRTKAILIWAVALIQNRKWHGEASLPSLPEPLLPGPTGHPDRPMPWLRSLLATAV